MVRFFSLKEVINWELEKKKENKYFGSKYFSLRVMRIQVIFLNRINPLFWKNRVQREYNVLNYYSWWENLRIHYRNKWDLSLSCPLKKSAFTFLYRSFSYFHEVYVFFFSIPRVHDHARRRSTLHPSFTYPLTCALHDEIIVSLLKLLRVITVNLVHESVSLNAVLFSQTVIITNYWFFLTMASQQLN